MKSKLLKLKERTAKEWCLVFCRIVCIAAIVYAVVIGKYIEACLLFALCGWSATLRQLNIMRGVIDDHSNSNDRLIVINKELNDMYNEQISITQGLISENKELKIKLKNVKMENARIRKGGARYE